MAIGLTRRQAECLSFIEGRIRENNVAPSYDEIAAHLGLKAKSGAFRVVLELEQRGFVRRPAKRARAVELVQRVDVVFCPHCHNVAGSEHCIAVAKSSVLLRNSADQNTSKTVPAPRTGGAT